MEIKFTSDALCERCNEELLMVATYGLKSSSLLQVRLLQLSAADCLAVFSPQDSSPTFFNLEKKDGLWLARISLKDGYVLYFEAIGLSPQSVAQDLNDITTIIIHSVEREENE